MSDNSSTSTWIYIILTLIGVLISFIKKQKAKKQVVINEEWPENKQEEPVPNNFPWWDMETDEEVAEQVIEAPIQYTTIENRQESVDQNITNNKYRNILLNPEEETEPETIDFNLKEAVIYSEILNRKYD